MKKIEGLIVLCIFTISAAFAQSKTVSGTVADENGKPIPFATVSVKDKKAAVAADGDGKFYISNISAADALVISAAGYITKSINVGGQNVINVVLAAKSSTQLNEVVITALGIKRQPREIGYSTARIKSEELTQAKIIDIATGLSAKIAGLQVNLVNNSINPDVRIVSRGNHSLQGK